MDKVFVGQSVSKLDTGRPPEPVSRVTLVVDGENAYTAGDDSGRAVEKSLPWATQEMAERVLEYLRGVTYRPFEGTDAMLDPAAEIGDGVTVGGVYSILGKADITFDGLYTSDIAAPGGDEVEDEYPYQSRAERKSKWESARIRSSITKTAERITLMVENEVEGLNGKLELTASNLSAEISDTANGLRGELQLTASNFQTQINGLNGAVSTISQKVDNIRLSVVNGESSSYFELTSNGAVLSSGSITLTGMVTFTDLDGSSGTIIDGGAINTNTLKLNSLYGNFIYINDAAGQTAAIITATGASSYYGSKYLLSSGAIELDATDGDIYLYSHNAALQLGSNGVQITGDLIPNAPSQYSCGSYGFRWTDVYADNGSIVTSDREKKRNIDYDLTAYGALFDALRPVSYRLRNGTSGRTHLGLIAQDVERAMGQTGLTDMDFAGLIKSPREDGGFDYALRYGEFIPLCIGKVQELTARVAELEGRLAQ